MTTSVPSSHLTHGEWGSPREMHSDAREVGRHLRLDQVARAVTELPPSIHFEDYPREIAKREIRVSDAAMRLANALYLHLD